MNTLSLLQVSESVVVKSAEMAEKDPHGIIITAVSVCVVFAALTILYFAYTFIGKAVNFRCNLKKCIRKPESSASQKAGAIGSDSEIAAAIALALDQELNGEVYAAISMAMHQYLTDTVHDNESYVITIKRK